MESEGKTSEEQDQARLEEERNRLMNSFGQGRLADGIIRDRTYETAMNGGSGFTVKVTQVLLNGQRTGNYRCYITDLEGHIRYCMNYDHPARVSNADAEHTALSLATRELATFIKDRQRRKQDGTNESTSEVR